VYDSPHAATICSDDSLRRPCHRFESAIHQPRSASSLGGDWNLHRRLRPYHSIVRQFYLEVSVCVPVKDTAVIWRRSETTKIISQTSDAPITEPMISPTNRRRSSCSAEGCPVGTRSVRVCSHTAASGGCLWTLRQYRQAW